MSQTTEAKAKVGRRPVADKKIPVTIYRPKSEITALGGLEKTRETLNNQISQLLKSN
jgi:hypothetical protein